MFETALCSEKDKRFRSRGIWVEILILSFVKLVQQGVLTSVSLSFLLWKKEVQCLSHVVLNENLMIQKMWNLAQCFTHNKLLTDILVSLTYKIHTSTFASYFTSQQLKRMSFSHMLGYIDYLHFQIICHISTL